MAFMKTDTAVDNATVAKDDKFLKIKQGTEVRVRKLPPMSGSNGQTMFKQVLHYKLKDPNSDDGKRGIALGCGKFHGKGTCIICDVCDVLKDSSDPNENKYTKFEDGIHASTSVYVQVIEAHKTNKKGVYSYGKPQLLKMPEASAQGMVDLNNSMQNNDLPLIEDTEQGQDVVIKNPSAPGKYSFIPTSVLSSLDSIAPNAANEAVQDVVKFLDTKVWSDEKIKETLRHSVKGLDWDAIFADAGV